MSAKFEISAISSKSAYKIAMVRIDALMEMNEGAGPARKSVESDELEVLSILAERYEEKAFPMDFPTLAEAVRFALEQTGLGQTDLGKILGSRPRASELLNGRLGGLSRSMMQVLHDKLHIPAEILIRDMKSPALKL
ncbi:MAG: transcriptional regulator [Rhodospirillales bacterium]|nr:transcriptional regulator [Rhodospirillales bacterium]